MCQPRRTASSRSVGEPPAPLKWTLDCLADLLDDTLLVQYNDRAPQYLYPKLQDRGYVFETVDMGTVVTAIWR